MVSASRCRRAQRAIPLIPPISLIPFSLRERGVRSVAEIHVLQGVGDLEALDVGDRGLQVVAFLAADAQLVALDRGLDLELRALDLLDDRARQLGVDALLDG